MVIHSGAIFMEVVRSEIQYINKKIHVGTIILLYYYVFLGMHRYCFYLSQNVIFKNKELLLCFGLAGMIGARNQ